MTKTTKYFAIDPRGNGFTRNSKRTYTHMVCARPSYQHALSGAMRTWAVDRKDFDYYIQQIEMGPHGYATLERIEEFKKIVAAHADRNAYALEKAHARKERVEELEAEGYYREYQDMGWCGRPDLAEKLATKISSQDGGRWEDASIRPAFTEEG